MLTESVLISFIKPEERKTLKVFLISCIYIYVHVFANLKLIFVEIIARVRQGNQPFFRPNLEKNDVDNQVSNLMQRCWHEDPYERPEITQAKKTIEVFNKFVNSSFIVDLHIFVSTFEVSL